MLTREFPKFINCLEFKTKLDFKFLRFFFNFYNFLLKTADHKWKPIYSAFRESDFTETSAFLTNNSEFRAKKLSSQS